MAPSDFAMADLRSILQSTDTALMTAVLFFCLGLLLVVSIMAVVFLGTRIHQWLVALEPESPGQPVAGAAPTPRIARPFERAVRLSEEPS